MAQAEEAKEVSKLSSCDAYFEAIQSRKKLPHSLQETLTAAFARIPVLSFPNVPGGRGDSSYFIAYHFLTASLLTISSMVHALFIPKGVPNLQKDVLHPTFVVIEIMADTTIPDAVKILSECNILSAPVKIPDAPSSSDWKERYLGIVDYSAIILWVLETAELAAAAFSVGTATAAGVGTGTVGALGALALGMTGPATVAGLTVAAAGAAVAGGLAAEKGAGKDAPTAADRLHEDFYKVILQEEPFKSTTVS